jgi:hypothetical protein
MAAQKFSLREGITVLVKEFVLINVNDKNIEEALAVTPVEEMSEVLDELLFTALGTYTVSDIVVPFVGCGSLRDYLILNLVNIVGMDHTAEGPAHIFIEFLKAFTSVKPDDIRLGKKYSLVTIGFIDKKTAGQTCRYQTSRFSGDKIFCHKSLPSLYAETIILLCFTDETCYF